MADPDYYVSLPSRRGMPSPSTVLSPRLASSLRRRDTRTPRTRLHQEELPQVDEHESDEDYVEQVYEGSLVHYYPEERKISKLEKKFEFTGAMPVFLGFQDFISPEVWRAAINEFLATALLVFVNTAGALTCLQAGFTSSTAAIGVITFLCLSFFILAAAPASGGHLNPAITFATMLAGFSSPARTLMYVIGQTAGAAVGALALKAVVAESVAETYGLGGCYLKNTILSDGALVEAGIDAGPALLAEFIFTLVVLFFAFSIALDPKQFQVTGPILAPFMIGAVIALMSFMSSGLMAVNGGYTGAGLNPVRCFGPAVAMGGSLWSGHWVFWVGPFFSALAMGVIYYLVPPHHVELYRSRADIFTQLKNMMKGESSSST
ncbi:hypothetical protein GOP47_0007968 [Adiantum capillus-veneris]|uniref:Uncharacterized protein n=1 Tax=Adiantum capillus-veneris TaxID=13818 RepID=A0A9D4ZJT3_ADICA|nr:hypothetical protein GOP47_0007524 [Adiantum capillus-veneris]KAI5078144.1 hypothetical protein GOP47_0007968 [Adiantum capillus-veneris]